MKKFISHKIVSFLLLTCMCVTFAPQAEAQTSYEHPKWIETSASIVLERNKSITDLKNPDYWRAKVTITYKNNSIYDCILSIQDKTLYAEFQLGCDQFKPHEFYGKERIGFRYIEPVKATLTSKKVNKVEIYPTQFIRLTYVLPVKNFMTPLAEDTYGYDVETLNKEIRRVKIKLNKWRHGFEVRSANVHSHF